MNTMILDVVMERNPMNKQYTNRPCQSVGLTLLCLVLGMALAFVFVFAGFVSSAHALTVSNAPVSQVLTGGSVLVIAQQTDGKVVIGGNFAFVNGVARTGLARINADGSLDTTWNPNPDAGVTKIAIDSAGNIYVGGGFKNIGGQARAGLAKLSSSGSGVTDPTWNPNPSFNLNGGISGLAFDPVSGALYVCGDFSAIGGQSRNYIAKLSTLGVGSADATWNPNPNNWVGTPLIDSSGNLYVAGGFTTIGGLSRHRMAKISEAGVVDSLWDPNPTGVSYLRLDAMALDPLTGGIYVGGWFDSIGGQSIHHLAKLSSTGSGAAIVSWNPNAMGEVTALAADASGNVYAGGLLGSAGGQNRNTVKLSGTTAIADAAWDPLGAFDVEQGLLPGFAAYSPLSVFSTDAYGNVFAGGQFLSIGGLTKTGFALLSKNGQGAASPAWPSVQLGGVINAIARDSAGRTIIGGSFSFMGDGVTVRNNIARLNSDTTLDTTWNSPANNEVDALAVDPSDNVYAGGKFTVIGGLLRYRLARLAASGGAADGTWNPGPSGNVNSLALDSSHGSLFVGGWFTTIGNQFRTALAKLSTSGSGLADATWNPTPALSVYNASPVIGALALDGSGNLYVGGSFTSIGGQDRISLAKLSTSGTGTADGTWNPNPSFGTETANNFGIVSLALDGGGNLYVGGVFSTIGGQARNHLARLSTTGSGAADATWNPNPSWAARAMALDGSGHLYVGGNFPGWNGSLGPHFSVGGAVRNYLARLFTSGTGTADCHWIANAAIPPSYSDPISALVVDASNNLYVGGSFSQINGTQSFGFARLTGDTAEGCKLAVTSVNDGFDPSANFPFSLTVQSQDSTGMPQMVASNTLVTQSVATGTGSLSGTTSCQINPGAYTCTIPAGVYSKVESGVVLTASRASGDVLTSGNSGPLNFIAALPPVRLAVLDVNGGVDPVAATGFPISVQVQDANGKPANVTTATTVNVWASGGTGVLTNGYPTCQINVGSNSCTLTGVTYSKAESGIIFTANASYGTGYLAGNSQPMTIHQPTGGRTLTVINQGNLVSTTPAGISCASGTCTAVYPVGSSVTLNFTGGATAFGNWIGDCGGTATSCALTMDADKVVSMNTLQVGSSTSYTSSFAGQVTTTVAGTTNARVDQSRTRLLGRYMGSVVYDQTFDAPFTDAVVQAGISAADSAIHTAAQNPTLLIGAPVLTGSTDTLVSTTTRYNDVVTESFAVNTTSYIGPQTFPFGDLGNCILAPTNCTGPTATVTLKPGWINLNTLVLSIFNTSRTIVNTANHLLSSTYLVGSEFPNNDAALSGIAISSGTLSPTFVPATLVYTGSVPNSVASITVTPTLHDPAASILVNGTPVANGGVSPAIPLTVGNNLITVVVTAEDGATTKTYALTITRTLTLSIAFAGNGSGTVTSTTPDSSIHCVKGVTSGCSAEYPLTTSVTLAATGDWKSLFVNWSGGVITSVNPVTFTMDANKGVTATFNPNFKAKLMPGGTSFASIQDAYSSVSSGNITIQAQAYFFLEDLLFGNNTTVTLTGGMDSSYNPTTGYASVKSLIVGKGLAIIRNITIK